MCSFHTRLKSECGGHCSSVDNVILTKCKDNIRRHLSSCHLSWENMEEYELIIARAGLFDIPESQLEKMWICPRHRNVLGKEWRPLRSCQYPTHQGDKKKVKDSHVVQLKLAKEIHKMHGVTVGIGSRKYSILAVDSNSGTEGVDQHVIEITRAPSNIHTKAYRTLHIPPPPNKT